MILTPNIDIVVNAKDENFLTWLRLIKLDNFKDYEVELLQNLIKERLDKMNLELEWGCCGTNIIREKTSEK